MIRYALQFIVGPRPFGVDDGDLPWEPVPGHDGYDNDADAWASADEFDAAFDHRYTHRVVQVEIYDEQDVDCETERYTIPAPPPSEPAKPRKVVLRSQLIEHQSRLAFERNRDLLAAWLQLDTPRAFLDPVVELCKMYVAMCGSSVLTTTYANQLAALEARVATKGNLRLVR